MVRLFALPVTAREQHYVITHGAARFEDLLASAEPDITDLERSSVLGVH
jgi:hypothetical protein